MASTRRLVLKVGAAGIVILGAGAAGWSLTRAPRLAREPWRQASEGFGDPRLDALAYAVLAPNPHNMQPWRVRLNGEDSLTLFCDLDRLLPETDPPSRQVTIGLGCFLELFRQAAAENGSRAEFTYFPEGESWPILDQRPIAQVRLIADPGVARDSLFGDVLERRTSRVPYVLTRPVDGADLETIAKASVPGVEASWTNQTDRVAELRELTELAWEAEWSNTATRRESIAVTRIGKQEINDKPWGLTLSGPLLEGLSGIGLLTRDKMDDPASSAYQQSLDFYAQACRTAMAYVWTTTSANTRRDQLEAGRAWVRMQLAANAVGLSFHPLSQALQEFPAMAEHYKKAHVLLAGGEGSTVQMLARLGFADAPPPAPREPLTAQIVAG